MTLLTAVQDACIELGLNKPLSVLTSQDTQILQLLALANRAGNEIAKYQVKNNGWSFLQKQFNFNSEIIISPANILINTNIITLPTANSAIKIGMVVIGAGLPAYSIIESINGNVITLIETKNAVYTNSTDYIFSKVNYNLPSDYEALIYNTFYKTGNIDWLEFENLNAQEYEFIKNSGLSTINNHRFKIEGKTLKLDPPPKNILPYNLNYLSNAWIKSADGQIKSKFSKDDDICLINENLLITNVIWRFKSIKGLPYQEDYNTYQKDLDLLCARDAGNSKVLNLNGGSQIKNTNNGFPWGNWLL
jgi:hypothetical protein